MPYSLLHEAYQAFLRSGHAQTVFWSPGELPTVYTGTR